MFKKRYFVHRNNYIGIGIRKRLIPTRRLIKFLKYINKIQKIILSRLDIIFVEIIKDESIDDPTIFNLLCVFQKWMSEVPLIETRYDYIKWMERHSFDKEFRTYVSYFYSFLELETGVRENMLLAVEKKLRILDDLMKEEVR